MGFFFFFFKRLNFPINALAGFLCFAYFPVEDYFSHLLTYLMI